MSLICNWRQQWLIIGTNTLYIQQRVKLMPSKNSSSLEQRVWKLLGTPSWHNRTITFKLLQDSAPAGFRLDFASLDMGRWIVGTNCLIPRKVECRWLEPLAAAYTQLIWSASVWPCEQWRDVWATRLHLRCLNLIMRVNVSVYVWILCLDASPGKSRPPGPSRHMLIHTHKNMSSLTPQRTFKSAVGEASTNLYSLTLTRTHGDSL